MIRAMVVDDEALSRELVCEFLAKEEDIELVAECANGFEAVKAVSEHDPDVLFLDVQMPKLDGFEVLELLDREPIVVFVTAHDEYAIRAFEARALDYLLKPFTEERFSAAMSRVRERLSSGQARERVASQELRQRPLQRVLVRLEEGKIEVVPVARIDYVEAQDDAIVIVSGEARLRKQQTLGDLERDLDPARFVRIHRSYLLNLDRLSRVEPYAKDSRIALLRDGTKLPVSRSGYARLRELL
ncbi:MAG: LytR/AlgR family response regulator transcription factor [Thermoanaerobaculia bacterium]